MQTEILNPEALPKVLFHSDLIPSPQRHITKLIDQNIINKTLTEYPDRIVFSGVY